MRFKLLWFLSVALTFGACTSNNPNAAEVDCGSGGQKSNTSVGIVCSYAVVTGGFRCPDGVPHRIDLPGRSASEMARVLCTQAGVTLDRVPASSCVGFEERCMSNQVDGGADDGGGSDGGSFVCCPIDSFNTSEACGFRDKRIGGSARSLAECPGPTGWFDGPVSRVHNDENGCPKFGPQRGVGGMCGDFRPNCVTTLPSYACPTALPSCSDGTVPAKTWDGCPRGDCVPVAQCGCFPEPIAPNYPRQCGGIPGTECTMNPTTTEYLCSVPQADASTSDGGLDASNPDGGV